MEKKQLNISNFPVKLREALEKIADLEHRSFQAQVVHVLEAYVNGYSSIKLFKD